MRFDVYLATERVGRLDVDPDGAMSFTYDGGDPRSPALSLSMPCRKATYDDKACRHFFENMLPEGRMLEAAAAVRRLAPDDMVGLLKQYGRECPGAVSVVPEGEPPPRDDGYQEIPDREMADVIAHLAQDPVFASDARVRMSLAGAQSKTAVAVFDGRVHKPLGGAASTHIVKAATSRDYPDVVWNEAFCLTLAARVHLPVPKVEVRRFGGQECLFIERYDRVVEGNSVRRLHQEDFCQALGYPRNRKYEYEKEWDAAAGIETFVKVGPGVVECLSALRRTRLPIEANQDFIRRLVFNYLVGNADAHAKNFSLLYDKAGGAPSLAPAYDVTSTRIYSRLTTDFAMAIGHARTPAELDAAAWNAVFGRTPLSRRVPALASEMVDAVLSEAKRLQSEPPFGYGPPFSHIVACIGDQAMALGACLGRDIDPQTPPFILSGGDWAMS